MLDIDAEALNHCQEQLRARARAAWLKCLLLPADVRALAVVLETFHLTCESVVLRAREPLAAEIRLRWWAEVIEGKRDREAAGDPVARAVMTVAAQRPHAVAPLSAKVEAHIHDLASQPFVDRNALEGWAGETRSALLQLRLLEAGATALRAAEAAGHTGCAQAVAGLLDTFAVRVAGGQAPVPGDLSAALGVADRPLAALPSDTMREVVIAMAELGLEHAEASRLALMRIKGKTAGLERDRALAGAVLRRAVRRPEAVLEGRPVSQWRLQWALSFG